jgi:hypothetical protein
MEVREINLVPLLNTLTNHQEEVMEQETKEYQVFGKSFYVPRMIHDQYVAVTDIIRGKDTTQLDRESSLKVLANVLLPKGEEWTSKTEQQQLEQFHRIDMETEVAALQSFFVSYVNIVNGMLGVLEILTMQNELAKMNLPKLLEQLQALKDANQSQKSPESFTSSPAAN